VVNAAGGRRRWAYSRAWRVRRVRPRALIGIAHRYGRIATRMAGGGVGRPRPTHPLPLCLPVAGPSMVARIGFSATTSRESRQGRKAAAAATMSGAGARAGASCLLGACRTQGRRREGDPHRADCRDRYARIARTM